MKSQALHSPTLESIGMVEKVAEKYSGEYGKYQLWNKLPRKMMYQTFCHVIDYLENSGKIIIDPRDRKIVWIWNPELVKKILTDSELIWN